jgi:hypothetical protein
MNHGGASTLTDASSSLNIEDAIFFLINKVFVFNYLNLRSLVIFQDMLLRRLLIGWVSRRDNLGILVFRAVLRRNAGFLFLIGKVLRGRFWLDLRRWFLNVLFGRNGLNFINKLTDLLGSDNPLALASLNLSVKLIKKILSFLYFFNERLYGLFSSLDPSGLFVTEAHPVGLN